MRFFQKLTPAVFGLLIDFQLFTHSKILDNVILDCHRKAEIEYQNGFHGNIIALNGNNESYKL